MSWQPMMYIPRAIRMRGQTWLIAALCPLVALLVAYLVALLSLVLGPSLEQLAQAAGEDISPLSSVLPGLLDGVPSTAISALVLTLLGLAAPMSMTVKLITDLGFPFSFHVSLWMVPLTLTLVTALVIFLLHRRECRGISQSGFMVAIPALISGAVLAAIAGVASLFTTINLSVSPQLLSTFGEDFGLETSMSLSALWLVLGAFALGFLPAALARLNAIRPRRTTYVYTSLPSQAHAFAHALRTSFLVLIGAVLATGVYMTVYALFKLDGAPATILFYAVPFVVNIGIVCLFGSIGGLGVVTTNTPSDFGADIPVPADETLRGLIFDGAPWTIWIMAILVVSSFVLGAIYWGRTRDPRTERGVLSWLALPISFIVAGSVAMALNMLVVSGAIFGETMSVVVRLSWLDVLWIIGIGIIMEVISRFARPRGPLSAEQFIPGIYQGYGQAVPAQAPPFQPMPGHMMPAQPMMAGQPMPGQFPGQAPGQPMPSQAAGAGNAPYYGGMSQGPGSYSPAPTFPTQQVQASGTPVAGPPGTPQGSYARGSWPTGTVPPTEATPPSSATPPDGTGAPNSTTPSN